MNVLLGIFFAVSINILGFGIYGVVRGEEVKRRGERRFLLNVLFASAVSAVPETAVILLIQGVSAAPDRIVADHYFVFLAVPAVCCVYMVARYAAGRSAEEKPARWCGVAQDCCIGVAAVLFCELFVFNYQSYLPACMGLKAQTLSPENAVLSQGAGMSGGSIVIGGNGGTVVFRNVDAKSSCFTFDASGNTALCNVSVDLTDENFTALTYNAGSRDFCTRAPESLTVPVYSSGKINSVRFTFNSASAGLRIRGISMNKPAVFLSFPRFLLLSLLVLAAILVVKLKLWKVTFNPHSLRHNLVVDALIVVLCLITLFVGKVTADCRDIAYPLSGPVDQYGCYIQQFDAFQKGRVDLDIKADPKLARLQNPYDVSQRTVANAYYSWDRSYYNGKYYSYFGVTPLFVLYYPYYLVRGKLPADITAATIFTILSILLLVLLVRELVCRFCKKPNFLMMLLGMTAAVFVSLLYTLQASADFYYIAILSGITFLSLFLLLTFHAFSVSRRAAWLFFAGVAFVLMVGSRPSLAVYALLVVPLFAKFLLGKDLGWKKKLPPLGLFALPVLLGAAGLMAYNAARFGSPFEFGQHYQLTVDNMRYNKFSPLNILPAVYYFFFQFPTIVPQFPFIQMTVGPFSGIAGFKLHELIIGAFSFPVLWSLFFVRLAPSFKAARLNRSVFRLAVLSAVILAVLDFSMSGTNVRYVADILPVLSLVSVVITVDVSSLAAETGGGAALLPARRAVYIVAVAAVGLSVLLGAATLFSNERDNIVSYAPWLYAILEKTTMLW